jgi:hypothetical protein
MKRVVVVLMLSCGLLYGEAPWNPSTTYVIPQGETYYLDSVVSLTSNLTIYGSLALWQGAVLNTDVSSVYNNNILTVTGGILNIQSGAVLYNGDSDAAVLELVSGNCNIVGGELRNNVSHVGAIRITGGACNLTDGALYNAYGMEIDQGALSISGGTFYNNGSIAISGGALNQSGGMLYNSASDITLSSGILYLSGGVVRNSGTIVIEHGTCTLGATANISNGYSGTGNFVLQHGSFNLYGGSIVHGSGTSNISVYGAVLSDIVAGLLEIPAGQTMNIAADDVMTIEVDAALVNGGELLNMERFIIIIR